MFRPKTLPALLALLFAGLAHPVAAASPCASPCGDVQVVLDCATVTVTAEGAGGDDDTVWRFLVYESVNYGHYRTTDETQVGRVAAFHHAGALPLFYAIYTVDAYLYADGVLVDGESWGCI